MAASAEGIDVSAYQLDLTVHDLSGLSFAFTKATDGIAATDPNFAHDWATIKLAGLHRGTYHELQAGPPAGQASHFLAAVQAQGLEPGDMLAVVASDYPGVSDDDVLIFCEAVRAATAGLNPVLPYTDLSVGAALARTSAAFSSLWVAWPSPVAPPMPLAGWRKWLIWQWGTRLVPGLGHVDANGYNGTPADMSAWIASFKPKPPPPPPPPPGTAAIPFSGDDMFILPPGAETIDLTVPLAVVQADGTWGPPSELRLSCSSPAQFMVALGTAEPSAWQPFNIDHQRSPQPFPITDPAGLPYGVVKLQRTDKNLAPVTGDFT
jgi:GH25 family lysozyme M1 (1,4-beta-N-acetylmuramidase)